MNYRSLTCHSAEDFALRTFYSQITHHTPRLNIEKQITSTDFTHCRIRAIDV